MNDAELQKKVEARLAFAGIMPYVARQKSQYLTDLPEWFVEIVVTDASKQSDAERILKEFSAELRETGQGGIDAVIRSIWEVGRVWFAGPARNSEGAYRAALDFRADLKSGEQRTEVRVDVTILALAVLRQHLGKEGPVSGGWSPQRGDVEEQDIAAVVGTFLEMELRHGGTSYWDPLLDSHLELNEPAMSYVLGHSAAFQELRNAINDAFSEPVLQSFIGGLDVSHVNMADFDRVLPDLSNMLGGAYRRGQRFSVSAHELFNTLSRSEQELVRRYFLSRARKAKAEQPRLAQEYPEVFANV